MLCSLHHLGTPGQPGWLYRLKVEEDIKVLTPKKQLKMALNKICKKVIPQEAPLGLRHLQYQDMLDLSYS